jgi:hypothetical protein
LLPELDQNPKLEFLHTGDAYTFSGEFGRGSAWEGAWGYRNETERNARLLRFAKIIEDHLAPIWNAYEVPDRQGLTWMVSHDEYRDFRALAADDPRATEEEIKTIKNPYFLSFQYVLGACLKYKNVMRTRDETIQILFDRDIDKPKRLALGFKNWLQVVEAEAPHLLSQLVNKQPEYRDDKKHPELQAADLLAYHLRKYIMEITQNQNRDYANNEIWTSVHSSKIAFLDLRYEAKQWRRLVGKIRQPFWPFWGSIRPKGRL